MTSNDVLAEVTPACDSGLALVANDGELSLVALLGVDVRVDVENNNRTEMAHALLSDTKKLTAVGAELDTLDGGGEVPCLEALAGLDVPQADGVVGATAGDHGRGRLDINGPDGTLVALVRAEALAIVSEPNADLLILRYREEEIAVSVEPADRGAEVSLGLEVALICLDGAAMAAATVRTQVTMLCLPGGWWGRVVDETHLI